MRKRRKPLYDRLLELYHTSRIYHINGNIVLAGVLSTIITAFIINVTTPLTEWIIIIVGSTALLDAIFDFGVFALLSYWSSTYKRKKGKKRDFFKDLGTIQRHRFILSPVYYICAMGLQTGFLLLGVERGLTVFLAYLSATVITRLIHTWYGLRTGLFQ